MRLFTAIMLSLSLFFWTFAPTGNVAGQEAPAPASSTVVLPFEFEGLIFVQAEVNGTGPYKFLFDSGASTSVLNQRLTRKLDLKEHDAGGAVQGVGSAEAKMVVLEDLSIGAFKKERTIAASMNFDHMSGVLGFHMMGIIGQNMLRMMKKIELDFSTNTLTITRFGADEMPNDTDAMLADMLEGGGMQIPGLPGLPRREPAPEKPPEGKPGPSPEKEEEFSAPAGQSWVLLQEEPAPEQAPGDSPREAMSLSFTSPSLPLFGEMMPMWNIKCMVNGQEHTFMFDTGASMLLALDAETATALKVPTSYSYTVKGIGTDTATAGLLDSFTIGNLNVEDASCTILKLPKASDQLWAMLESMMPDMDETMKQVMRAALRRFTGQLDFSGIVGLPLALRYKKMVVNTPTRTIDFVPYAKGEINAHDPGPDETLQREATLRTWNGEAADFGITGDAVPLDDWEKLKLTEGGLRVGALKADGPAAKAGLMAGDIVTHVLGIEGYEDGLPVRDGGSLVVLGCLHNPGHEVRVRVRRGDETKEIPFKLAEFVWRGEFPERHKR